MMMADEQATSYQANSIAAASHCLRLLWAHSVDGSIPNPETDHRIGMAFQGFLSDELIAGNESWAVPIIVGAGAGWSSYIGIHRALQAPADDSLEDDADSDDDDSDDYVADDSADIEPVEGDEHSDKERNRTGYRRRR